MRAAVAAQGTEGIAGEALAVHPHQHCAFGLFWLAFHDRHMLTAIELVAEADGAETAEGARERGLRLAAHEALGIEPVADQIGDVDQPQAVALGVVDQLRQPRHRAIHVLDLADHPGGIQTGEARQIHCGLGVASALEHATLLGAQRKDVAGPA